MRGTEYLIYFFFCSYFPYFSFLSPFIFVFIFIFLHFFLFRFYYFFYIIKNFFSSVCMCLSVVFVFTASSNFEHFARPYVWIRPAVSFRFLSWPE